MHILINGSSAVIPADTIIVCAGQVPQRALFDELQASSVRTSLIGGAFEAAELDAKRAIQQAVELAARI